MRLAKLPYYARAAWRLLRAVEAPQALAPLAWGRSAELRLRGGPTLGVAGPLDALVAVETLLDDCYGLDALRAPACIVDVGAGNGDFCIAAALRFPTARVLAFEPAPACFERLRANALRNRVANLELHACAIGTATSASLAAARAPALTRAVAGGTGVAMERLGRFLPAHVDLLKIDCEGAERDVLASIGDAAWPRIAALAIELHARSDREPVRALLAARGYRVALRPDRFDPELALLDAVSETP
jgi:FkbM family methyltransferase